VFGVWVKCIEGDSGNGASSLEVSDGVGDNGCSLRQDGVEGEVLVFKVPTGAGPIEEAVLHSFAGGVGLMGEVLVVEVNELLEGVLAVAGDGGGVALSQANELKV